MACNLNHSQAGFPISYSCHMHAVRSTCSTLWFITVVAPICHPEKEHLSYISCRNFAQCAVYHCLLRCFQVSKGAEFAFVGLEFESQGVLMADSLQENRELCGMSKYLVSGD